jgi:alpha-L-fucosidase
MIDYHNIEQGLEAVDAVIAAGPYRDEWDSLAGVEAPRWFCTGKFGVFIHWGVFSVPAYANEWYPRNMYRSDDPAFAYHRKTYGAQDTFGYQDFIPRFTMEHFAPDAWAALFADAGARYVVPVAEHHDGFQMYRSAISRFNAVQHGPRRDLLGDLKQAVEAAGLVFGASSHRAEHWFFLGHGRDFDSDVREPLVRGDLYWPSMPEPADLHDIYGTPYPTDEYMRDWLLRTAELIDCYQPHLLYFDWWIQHAAFRPYLKKALAFYRNRAASQGTEAVFCYKYDAAAFGSGIVEIERGAFSEAKPFKWQTETPVAKNSWCYTAQNEYKAARDIVRELVDVVSKNGNLLLNIGPAPDGTIPAGDEAILRAVGAWLRINGEAIYGTNVWRVSAEGPTGATEGHFQDNESIPYTAEDFRFTCSGGVLYAIALNYPLDGHIRIRAFGRSTDPTKTAFRGIVRDVNILGFGEHPEWIVTEAGLECSTRSVASEYPVVFRIDSA